MSSATIKRCPWVSVDDPLMLQYHDREWVSQSTMTTSTSSSSCSKAPGRMQLDDCTEEAGKVSAAFDEFDPEKVARFSARRIA